MDAEKGGWAKVLRCVIMMNWKGIGGQKRVELSIKEWATFRADWCVVLQLINALPRSLHVGSG